MITLSRHQSFDTFLSTYKLRYIQKHKIASKTKAKCIACSDLIYISFKSFDRKQIFCDKCKYKFYRDPTIAQYNYMKYIKDSQLRIIGQANNPPFVNELRLINAAHPDNTTNNNHITS
jgi:hypothetical protein